ncbi:MAG: aldolase, partial [Thermoplasmata archaeon]|nr:aldolase [Thermoplasmata archaeon]
LEGKEAIANIDGIIEVDGIDIIFIGPYDLSQSLGVMGQVDHPSVREKMIEIIEKSTRKGISVGTFVETLDGAKNWMDLGIKYISYSVDVGIFYEACREIAQALPT